MLIFGNKYVRCQNSCDTLSVEIHVIATSGRGGGQMEFSISASVASNDLALDRKPLRWHFNCTVNTPIEGFFWKQ
jgi:hypothetical protein